MSDLSKRRPQIDFCAGYRAHKRGDPREGCSKAWHEGWDAHAELAAERERADKLAVELADALNDAEDLNVEVEHYANLAIVDLGANPTVSWQERAEAAEARVAKLREALEPFADAADWLTSKEIEPDEDAADFEGRISYGDLRRARAVLEETE